MSNLPDHRSQLKNSTNLKIQPSTILIKIYLSLNFTALVLVNFLGQEDNFLLSSPVKILQDKQIKIINSRFLAGSKEDLKVYWVKFWFMYFCFVGFSHLPLSFS